jgi:release factor glutamine methyltransferase
MSVRAREAIARATWRLQQAGVDSPGSDAELLLAHVLGLPRGRVGLADDLTSHQAHDLDALVTRRARREPLQHILGTAAFRYVEVEVGPGVFVPRPETELLAGWAVDRLRGLEAPVVVDLCTGSGAIALALATEVPHATMHAVELAEAAFEYARRNLSGTAVDLRCGDVATAFSDLDGSVDLVVANPPYIPLGAYASVAVEAREYDPPLSLWSGEDGLETIRVIETTAARLLRPGGWAGCEHADAQGESAPAVFARSGRWAEVRDRPDLAGRPRFVIARRR